MRLRLKTAITIRPDKHGEYPEEVGKRLISSGIAELETASIEYRSERRRRRKNK